MNNFLKPLRHTSVHAALMHRMKKIVVFVAYATLAALAVHWLIGGQDEIINGDAQVPGQVMDIREYAKDSPAYVLDQHRKTCWTSKQIPKAALPGAAVIQFKDGHAEYVTNDTPVGYKLVDIAFKQALASIGYGPKIKTSIETIALCV